MKKPNRTLIFVNGSLPKPAAALALIQPGDCLIAADGGARHLLRAGLLPHFLVGDLDSLTGEEIAFMEQHGVTVQRYPPEKDETDLELALLLALEQGSRVVCIVAALGGRLDQTLANLFLLQHPALEGCDVRLDDGCEEVFLIRAGAEAVIHGQAGETLSLLPLGGAVEGVVTTGLQYPLRSETLYPERTRGVSNVLQSTLARVRLERGTLICVHAHKDGPSE